MPPERRSPGWGRPVEDPPPGTQCPEQSAGRPAGEAESKPWLGRVDARHRLTPAWGGKALARRVSISNRIGEIPPSGMIAGDAGNGLRHGTRHWGCPDEGPATATPRRPPAPRLRPTRPVIAAGWCPGGTSKSIAERLALMACHALVPPWTTRGVPPGRGTAPACSGSNSWPRPGGARRPRPPSGGPSAAGCAHRGD